VTVVSGDGSAPAAPAAAAPAPAAPQVAATPPPARPARPAPAAAAPAKATGQVAHEPGSGSPTDVGDEARKEMATVLTEFANAAGARNFEGMRPWCTERLGDSLSKAVETHTERLYRRTDMFTKGVQSGEVTIGATKDTGDGNYDVEFKFANGDSANVLMFKEEGKWRLNRL
jgi:hypothetical protein